MNAERLLALYERVAEAPDAIARLRRFILDLAVRGKLVPQDPQDEPIAKRYQKELGGTEIPASWRVLNFGKFCDIEGGNQPPKSQFIDEPREGYVRLLQIRDLGERPVPVYIPIASARSICKEGEILIGRYGASVGKVFWAQDGAYNVAMAKFIWPDDALMPAFAYLLLKSEYLQGPLAKATRSAQAGFNKGDLSPIDFPLPPLAEQHRIVAKLDELMALCDQLEAARQEREARRDRLAAASLAHLNAPDPETFQSDARFTLNALPALTTRPNQIKQLRQTILNLAVRGKLVPQDPNEEPASELLKRIAKEKARLVKAGEVKKEKPLEPITVENQPFNLPQSWSWVRLDFLSRLITKGSSPKWQGVNYVNADDGILFITSENVGNHELRKLDDLKYVESRFRDIEPRSMLRRGDILMNLVGASIGRTAIYNLDAEANINQAVALIRLVEISDGPLVRYLLQYLNSPTAIEFMLGSRVITAQPNMSLTDTREFPIPLPPLAEQHRIVAKVDELMALCDRLEASLTTSDQTRTRLLEATLAEALAPASISEMEAAE